MIITIKNALKPNEYALLRADIAARLMTVPRTPQEITRIVVMSSNRNPHNEPDKPPILSEMQAKAVLAVQEADTLLEVLDASR